MSGEPFYSIVAAGVLIGATVAGFLSRPRRCQGGGAMVRVRGRRHRHY